MYFDNVTSMYVFYFFFFYPGCNLESEHKTGQNVYVCIVSRYSKGINP